MRAACQPPCIRSLFVGQPLNATKTRLASYVYAQTIADSENCDCST